MDNVEHLYVTGLPAGRYDLQVLKYGGNAGNGNVITNETYALAFEFFAMPLTIAQDGTNAVLTWPLYPAGFVLESTPVLAPPAWSPIISTPAITNGENRVTVDASANHQFFRLRRP